MKVIINCFKERNKNIFFVIYFPEYNEEEGGEHGEV